MLIDSQAVCIKVCCSEEEKKKPQCTPGCINKDNSLGRMESEFTLKIGSTLKYTFLFKILCGITAPEHCKAIPSTLFISHSR